MKTCVVELEGGVGRAERYIRKGRDEEGIWGVGAGEGWISGFEGVGEGIVVGWERRVVGE